MLTRKYIDVVINGFTSTKYEVPKNTNSFTVRNIGLGVVAKVNGVFLQPPPAAGLSGESYGVPGNEGEIYDRDNIEVTFIGAATGQVQIIFKVYKEVSNV